MTTKYRRYRGTKKASIMILLLLALMLALLIPVAAIHLAAQKKASETAETAKIQAKSEESPVKSSSGSSSQTVSKFKDNSSGNSSSQKKSSTKRSAEKITGPAAVAPAKVDGTYFADAVFIGDSRTQGFSLYSGLKTPHYLCAQGATVASVYNKSKTSTSSGDMPIMTALKNLRFSKVYIMLGVNELGWVYPKNFTAQYANIICSIRAKNPRAKIVLQSLLPVSAKQNAKQSCVNNTRIQTYNALIKKLAAETGCSYLNVAEVFTQSNGCLPDNLSSDGLHLNVAGCKRWLQYLEAYPIS